MTNPRSRQQTGLGITALVLGLIAWPAYDGALAWEAKGNEALSATCWVIFAITLVIGFAGLLLTAHGLLTRSRPANRSFPRNR